MYYYFDGKLYTPKEIEGKTFSEESKPDPLFTLEEMRNAFAHGYATCDMKEDYTLERDAYFKQQFNITI